MQKKIVKETPEKISALMNNDGIIRNRLKINSVVGNAKAFLNVQDEIGSFDEFIWGFVSGKPIAHSERKKALAISERISKELKKRGFRFVGPTICFAYMQAVGMVNDHSPDCFRSSQQKYTK